LTGLTTRDIVAYQMRNACITAIVAVLCLTATATATAFSNSVTFIGDSVTAGFGFCGSENAKEVNCRPNQEFANDWTGENSLEACAPDAAPKPLIDACSNDNFYGKPWKQPPWAPGPNAPLIAYPFQLAAGQSPDAPASVSDWAVTGSTPADWDPKGGTFAGQLGELKNQYVVLTLGANPILSDFTDINFIVKKISGPCVSSTGYSEGWFPPKWYAGPLSKQVECMNNEWVRLNQTEHLIRIYQALLAQGDRVVVLGYYRGCNWSFGNWQPTANPIYGPADGYDCKTLKRPISSTNPTEVSQWQQAVAVSIAVNGQILAAVEKTRAAARKRWPGMARAANIVFAQPDPTLWEAHQPKGGNGSWLFLNDTWIHPSKAGHANLAQTVAKAMCTSFGHWCEPPEWKW